MQKEAAFMLNTSALYLVDHMSYSLSMLRIVNKLGEDKVGIYAPSQDGTPLPARATFNMKLIYYQSISTQ